METLKDFKENYFKELGVDYKKVEPKKCTCICHNPAFGKVLHVLPCCDKTYQKFSQ